MVTQLSSAVLADHSDVDVVVDVDDVPVYEPTSVKFRYGGIVYEARPGKDSVMLEQAVEASMMSEENMDGRIMMRKLWNMFAAIVDQKTFDEIARRYKDPEDTQASAARFISLVPRLWEQMEESISEVFSGLSDSKPKKKKKEPQDRKLKQA